MRSFAARAARFCPSSSPSAEGCYYLFVPCSRNCSYGLVAALLAILFVTAVSTDAWAKRNGQKDKSPSPANAEPATGSADTPSAQSDAPVIDVDRVLAHAKVLSADIGARPTHSEQAAQAAAYIKKQLDALDLEIEEQAVGTTVSPAIDLAPFFSRPETTVEVLDSNLIVRFAAKSYAKDSPLLFMAHYDSVPTSPGAVDNAVSVGLLLELARVLVLDAPSRRVIIAFTAAEEIQLRGALALRKHLGEDLGLAVSLDLVGGHGTLTLNGLSTLIGRGWLMWFAEVSKQAKIDLSAPWLHRVVSQLLPEVERSDHGPFTAIGVPSIHLYNRADELFLAYHTRHDTMSSVDTKSTRDAGKFIEMMTRTNFAFPKSSDGQGLWVPLPGSPKVASALAAQALELMFLLFGLMSIARLSRDAKEARASATGQPPPEGRSLGLAAALGMYVLVWLLATLLVSLASAGDHPLPWAHGPARTLAGTILLASALLCLFATQLGRAGAWRGDARYLVTAIVWCSLLGFLTLAFSVFELAWIFLWPAAALGGMARVKSRVAALVLWVLAALPLLGPFSPGFLREAVFHSFWPVSLPIAAYVAFFLFPYALALIFVLQRWPLKRGLQQGKAVLFGSILVALAAIALIATLSPPCSGASFKAHGLSCELEK